MLPCKGGNMNLQGYMNLTELTYRFLEPILHGRYPRQMQNILGSILPEFSTTEKQKLKQGLDFIGINHYTSYYVQDCMFSACEPGPGTSKMEGYCAQSSQKNGTPIGEPVSNINTWYQQLYMLNLNTNSWFFSIFYYTDRVSREECLSPRNGEDCNLS